MDSNLMYTIMVWAGIGFAFFALTMLAVIDVSRKEFKTRNAKIIWGIVAVFPFIGWLVYLLLGFWRGTPKR